MDERVVKDLTRVMQPVPHLGQDQAEGVLKNAFRLRTAC